MNIVMIDKDISFGIELGKFLRNNSDLNIIKVFNNGDDAISYMEKNDILLELVMLDLEITNINIEKIVDSLPKYCNLIALSETPEILKKYINYPYFQRIFQKPISFSTILNYLNFQNGIESFENTKKAVLKSLSKFGFNLNHAGTGYLTESVVIALRGKIKKLSEIYTLLAYNHDTDPKIVGWSINNAINKAVKSCDKEQMQDFFKITPEQKLTAKYIINYFINYYHNK